jgi:alpha-1,2-mannosyltransferase
VAVVQEAVATPYAVARAWIGTALALVLVGAAVGWYVHESQVLDTAALDIRVYRDAARALLDGGQVYAGRFDGLPFTYPPFALLVFVPLAVLPAGAAVALMFLSSAAALVAVVRWCQEYVTGGAACAWWLTISVAAVVSVVLEPLHMTFGLGQVNLLLMALVLGVDARATRWSGAGAGVATAIKVTPGLLVVAQLVRGDQRAFRRGVLAFLAATVVAALIAPAATKTYFTSLLWDSSRPGGLAYLQNQSLRGLAERHVPGHATAVWLLAATLALALGAWVVRRHRADPFYALTAAAITGLLVSPISWSHHWVWVLPAVAVGVRLGRRSPVLWVALGLVVAMVAVVRWWVTADAPLYAQDIYVVGGLLWLAASAAQRPVAAEPDS